jgi:hypothetical protein
MQRWQRSWTVERLRAAGGVVLVAAGAGFVCALVVGSGTMPSRPMMLHWLADRWLPLLIALASAALAVVGTSTWRAGRRTPGRSFPLADAPETPVNSGNPPARDWTSITTMITAFTALAALVFTALSLGATREQIGVAEQGQITDRYTRAIEQLGTPGSEHLQVRLGGIFTLERIAQDSPRDQPTIVSVLAAFIRTSSPRGNAALGADVPCPRTPEDVQAAFSVLVRRDHSRDSSSVDLRHTCLTDVSAQYPARADLTRMSFVGTDLSGANLYQATLGLTSFSDARLAHARLSYANFEQGRTPRRPSR